MKYKIRNFVGMLVVLIMTAFLLGCGNISTDNQEPDKAVIDMVVDGENTQTITNTPAATAIPKTTETPTPEPSVDEDGWYYSKEEVALYIYTYGRLPDNYLTKTEARELGWTGGAVGDYKEGAAIGGDKFGNREGLLPKKDGRQYYECDIDTKGKGSRGTRRIVFSNDGLVYYTHDHYESFELLYGKE